MHFFAIELKFIRKDAELNIGSYYINRLFVLLILFLFSILNASVECNGDKRQDTCDRPGQKMKKKCKNRSILDEFLHDQCETGKGFLN